MSGRPLDTDGSRMRHGRIISQVMRTVGDHLRRQKCYDGRTCEQLLNAYRFHFGRMLAMFKLFRSTSPVCTVICLFHANCTVSPRVSPRR